MPGIFIAFAFIVFFAVFGIIIFTVIKGISQWNKNNHSPQLSVSAKVVTKRKNVSHNTHMVGNTMMTSPSTTFYVTFEVESGDRMEFRVGGTEYGLLCEGDCGKLTFQGTRYIAFDRDKCLL